MMTSALTGQKSRSTFLPGDKSKDGAVKQKFSDSRPDTVI